MAAVCATSPIGAYQREASRLAAPTPRVAGKIIERGAGIGLGPFSVRYAATDYEFDLTGTSPQTPFADVLDAAATAQRLADSPSLTAPRPNALTRRQALAGYAATAARPDSRPPRMFTATV